MTTMNLNVRVASETMENFERACTLAQADKSSVIRMLMELAATHGIMYDPKTGNPKLRGK